MTETEDSQPRICGQVDRWADIRPWQSSVVPYQASDQERQEALRVAWTVGSLRYKLDPAQREVYDEVKAWLALDQEASGRLYMLDISRRFGKSTVMLAMAAEVAIQNPSWRVAYMSATQVMVRKIIRPLVDWLLQDCPPSLKPSWRASEYAYLWENGSRLELVGMDVHADRSRGLHLDWGLLDEAAFFQNLEYTLNSVIRPQMQGRKHARIIAGSTPPVSPEHYWTEVLLPQCVSRKAYIHRTIVDNPRLERWEIEQEVASTSGGAGIEATVVQRELFAQHVAEETLLIIPEFRKVEKEIVGEWPEPLWRDCYVALDPGFKDISAVLFGYWNFDDQYLFLEDEVLLSQESSRVLAEKIKLKEDELWRKRGIKRYRGGSVQEKVVDQPFMRISDVDAQLLHDLHVEHGLTFAATRKDNLEAQVNAVRIAIQGGQIRIHPRCESTIRHLRNGVWQNEKRTTFGRQGAFGHFDAIAALIYLWRNIHKRRNPYPPSLYGVDFSTHHAGKRQGPKSHADRLIKAGKDRQQSSWLRKARLGFGTRSRGSR